MSPLSPLNDGWEGGGGVGPRGPRWRRERAVTSEAENAKIVGRWGKGAEGADGKPSRLQILDDEHRQRSLSPNSQAKENNCTSYREFNRHIQISLLQSKCNSLRQNKPYHRRVSVGKQKWQIRSSFWTSLAVEGEKCNTTFFFPLFFESKIHFHER